MSNDTVMIRLQKDTYGSDFNLESGSTYHFGVFFHLAGRVNVSYECHIFSSPGPSAQPKPENRHEVNGFSDESD